MRLVEINKTFISVDLKISSLRILSGSQRRDCKINGRLHRKQVSRILLSQHTAHSRRHEEEDFNGHLCTLQYSLEYVRTDNRWRTKIIKTLGNINKCTFPTQLSLPFTVTQKGELNKSWGWRGKTRNSWTELKWWKMHLMSVVVVEWSWTQFTIPSGLNVGGLPFTTVSQSPSQPRQRTDGRTN